MGVKNSQWYKNVFTPLYSKITHKQFIGFDVETYQVDNTQKFYFGSLHYENKVEVFFDKDLFVDTILSRKNKGYWVIATNLSFDFSQLFFNHKYWNLISFVYRGSDIIMCEYKNEKGKYKIRLIDTMNYVPYSVKDMGKIIGINKLKSPEYMGSRKSKNINELNYFVEYNIRDSLISKRFIEFYQKGLNYLGGELKLTSASSSLNLFRRQFLVKNWYQEHYLLGVDSIEFKKFIFNAYYGGRCEVFHKGVLYNLYYYDINSLYPSAMLEELPDVNSVFIPDKASFENIISYEGVTYCYVKTPDYLDIPVLPIRSCNGKLLFPLGEWNGYYNNIELRKAISKGYVITPIKQILYKNTHKPFKSFVNTLYSLRLDQKYNNNPMQLITKLQMNSLYGKFGQMKKIDVDIKDLTQIDQKQKEDLLLYNESYDVKDDIAIKIENSIYDGVHCFPIIASYITSIARLKLYEYLEKYNVVYCDTDSIVTNDIVPNSDKLGEMKYESYINEAEFFKPKMYYIKTNDHINVKLKGVSKPTFNDIEKIKAGLSVDRVKMSKIRQSIRRGINPNTSIEVNKYINSQDDKRLWFGDISTPLIIDNSKIKNEKM